MLTLLADDLTAAREARRDRSDPAWCALRAVAQVFDLETDPLDERGYQGPWSRSGGAVETAIRLLVQGAGYTQSDAAERLGYSASKAYNARRPPYLDDDELDLLVVAEELHGGPLDQ